jgi:ribose transport system ATP-binding protein
MSGIRKRFGATAALSGVELDVHPGEVHAIVGENGAGKSTLMKILSGAYQPDGGETQLDGRPYRPRNPADARRAGVATIYQELSLAPHLSVAENILLGAEPAIGPVVNWSALKRRAAEALRQIGGQSVPLEVPAGRLSVAQQQLVEIARGVAVGCRVLILDEPTSSLAQADVQNLFELLRRLRSSGHSILYISHFLEEVREIGDRVTVLRDGRSVGSGTIATLATGSIIQLMVGREVGELYPRSVRACGEPALELKELSGFGPPHEASLTLHRGEVVGIAGLLGAGRTELLRTIFGLARVRSGEVRIGAFVGPHSPAHRWAQGVGMVSEDRKREGLALNLSVAENLTLPRIGFAGPLRLVSPRGQARAARPWIDRLAIRCLSAAQAIADLSGGNQQKVALARLLHADCDVLLLDEPTRGIDVGSKAEIYRLIDGLVGGPSQARQTGGVDRGPRAVLFVSSYLPELLGVCDRIAVMHRGRLGAARHVAELDEHRIMLEATGAGAAA